MICERHVLVPLCAASTLLAGTAAFAEIGSDTDIAGYSLAMTKAQARALSTSEGQKAITLDLPASIGMGGYPISTTVGFVKELRNDNPSAHIGDPNHVDRVKVLYNPVPNSTDIFAISRTVIYKPQDQMLHATVINALIEKYGRPFSVNGGAVYTWVSNAGGYNARVCSPDIQSHYPFFYEDIWDDRPLNSSIGETSQGLTNAFNPPIAQMIQNRSKCGIVLTVTIHDWVGANHEFVYSMSETLVDTGRGAADVAAFSNMLRSGSDTLHKQQLEQAQKNKPAL
jgi:hypothetical protein